MHHVFSSTGKQFKSCGVNASCIFDKEVFKKLWCQCIMFLLTRKQFKSYGINASCVLRQGNILKAVVSMYHMFGNREAF